MVKKNKTIDFPLLLIIFTLIIIGLVALTSASSYSSQKDFDDPFYFLIKQLKNLGIGIVLFFIALKINLKKYQKYFFHLFLLNLLLMFVVFIPGIGVKSGNSARWFTIAGFSIQPSEFLKLSFILYLASWLSKSKKTNRIIRKKGEKMILFVFLLIIALVAGALLLQSDLSTLLLILSFGGIMYFCSRYPLWHDAAIIGFIIIAGLIFGYTSPYRKERIETYLGIRDDPLGRDYQIEQAKIAVGSGELTGSGIGMSKQRFGSLPQPISDSIFAIIAEETGFIGATTVVMLFLLFSWRGFTISKEASDDFFMLVSVGITSWIFIQSFLNIAAIIELIPLTGIPLPFISYGGSALISELAAMGVLINISKEK